ncbi:oxidoreductase [Aureococcus anophagefferens]|nr:oxidoreductase [Aureococcus anophagefferens]
MMRALSALTLTSRAMSARALAPELTRTALAPTVTLASGYEMPVVALGTWKAPAGQTGAAVEAAIKAGYRNIDAANDYNNEPEVGAAIKKCIAEGVVTRDELFVQCKLWNANHRPEHVVVDLAQSLEDLQLEYVDSYVIHWPQACPASGLQASTRVDGADARHYSENPMRFLCSLGYFSSDEGSHYTETWRAMEALVAAGKCRSIGLSNFNKAQLEEVVAMAKVPVSILQNECHPAGQVILKHAIARGIAVVTKSVTKARVESNFELFDWDLSPEDTKLMDGLNCGWRHLHWRETSHHPDYPFRDELPFGYELEKVSNFAPGQ